MNVLLLHLIERRDEKKRLDHLKQDLRIIQLEHEKEDELVEVVVKVVHKLDCMMVAREIEDGLLEEMVRILDGGLSKTLVERVNMIVRRELVQLTLTLLGALLVVEFEGLWFRRDLVMSDLEDSTVTYTKAPPLPEFVPELVYSKFMPPEDEILPAKEQPLPAADSPTADSQRYILESDSEEDPADYPADGRDDDNDDDESSDDDEDDDDDDDDDDKEDEDEDKEKEHPTPADSIPPPPVNHDTVRMSIREQSPIPSCCTIHYILAPRSETPPSGTPPLQPIPLPTSSPPLLLPSTSHRADVPEVTLPPQKRLCISLGLRYEISESSSAATARPTRGFRADYSFVATLDDEIIRNPERELGRRMTNFVTTVRQDTDEIYERLDDAQDDRAMVSERVNMLYRDRRDHARTARLMETEARLSRQAWVQSMDASDTARAQVASLCTTVVAQ
nr:hypothetical protein [Tanacetum cinerariifolium]